MNPITAALAETTSAHLSGIGISVHTAYMSFFWSPPFGPRVGTSPGPSSPSCRLLAIHQAQSASRFFCAKCVPNRRTNPTRYNSKPITYSGSVHSLAAIRSAPAPNIWAPRERLKTRRSASDTRLPDYHERKETNAKAWKTCRPSHLRRSFHYMLRICPPGPPTFIDLPTPLRFWRTVLRLDRPQTLQEILGVSKTVAWRILRQCGASQGPGNMLICERLKLVAALESLRADQPCGRELRRRQRPEDRLTPSTFGWSPTAAPWNWSAPASLNCPPRRALPCPAHHRILRHRGFSGEVRSRGCSPCKTVLRPPAGLSSTMHNIVGTVLGCCTSLQCRRGKVSKMQFQCLYEYVCHVEAVVSRYRLKLLVQGQRNSKALLER